MRGGCRVGGVVANVMGNDPNALTQSRAWAFRIVLGGGEMWGCWGGHCLCLCAVLWVWLVCALQFGCVGIVLGAGGGCVVQWACVGGA